MKILNQTVESSLGTCTTVVTAHRLSTVKKADKILVLEHGETLESGIHNQLIALEDARAQMFANDFSSSESNRPA